MLITISLTDEKPLRTPENNYLIIQLLRTFELMLNNITV